MLLSFPFFANKKYLTLSELPEKEFKPITWVQGIIQVVGGAHNHLLLRDGGRIAGPSPDHQMHDVRGEGYGGCPGI